MRPSPWFVASLLVSLGGCDAGNATLVLQLRTDYVAGAEVARIAVDVEGDAADRGRAVTAGEDLSELTRIAEIPALEAGSRAVTVRLIGPGGEELARRLVVVDLRMSTAVTVLITRNCEGVTCEDPARPACVDARCVPAGCVVEDAEACDIEDPCSSTSCAPEVGCASAECVGGFCLDRPEDARCGPDAYCHSALDCQPRAAPTDAGVADAGPAGLDGGVDAGGFDAGGSDGGPSDAAAGCADPLEPNQTPGQAADAPVATGFGIGGRYTEMPLESCAGDPDWIGLATGGVVRVSATLITELGGSGTVCVQLYVWSDLQRSLAAAPLAMGSPLCLLAGDAGVTEPVVATLDGGRNYVLAEVTSTGDPIGYEIGFTGTL